MKTKIQIKMNSKLKQHRIEIILVVITLTSGINAFAQKSVVLDVLSKHNVDNAILNSENLREADNLSFELEETTITTEKTDVIVAKFDHTNPKPEQWTVISVNGSAPSQSKIKSFRKNRNNENTSIRYDDATYKIEKESSDLLLISFKQHPSSNSKDAAYMKDCRFYMTVNLKTKRMEQVQVKNEKPIRLKVIITAEKFDLVTNYIWDEQLRRYLPADRTLNLTASIMGQQALVKTITNYTYQK